MATNRVQFSRIYGFIRARQLEGTFPGDAKTGVRGFTTFRVKRGWGNVLEREWPYPSDFRRWPPAEPPDMDEKAMQYRILFYQRVNKLDECKLALVTHGGVAASFRITKQWFNARKGIIAKPSLGDNIVGGHSIALIGYDDAKMTFTFQNSWGVSWGDKGYGYLPYDFFGQRLIEAYVVGGVGQPLPGQPMKGTSEIAGCRSDYAGRVLHVRDIYDADADDRIGWAFALEEQDRLIVEELYVKPRFTTQDYRNRLLRSLRDLSARISKPLRDASPSRPTDSPPPSL